jgi:hypothetical protein
MAFSDHFWATAVNVACIVLAYVIMSAYTVITSIVLGSSTVSPLVYALLRDILATVVLLSVAWRRESRIDPSLKTFFPAKADIGMFVFVGVMGVWGNQVCFLYDSTMLSLEEMVICLS